MKWNQINIPNGETTLFCNIYISDKSAMNIIITHTPILSTLDMQQVYAPLAQYGINLFAFDFSGTGNSGGMEKDISCQSLVRDLDAVVSYIEKHYSSNIHLYGSTGIGGMFAQYYACCTDRIKSFAQFACVDYKNTSGLGYPYSLAKLSWHLLKILPNFKFKMAPPKYTGWNCEKDNAVYKALVEKHPRIWYTSTKLLCALLECFVSPNSPTQNSVQMPTLVFKTMHDRYFSQDYFDAYFNSLTCEKKLVVIPNTHNSYFFESETFCKAAYEWFAKHQS